MQSHGQIALPKHRGRDVSKPTVRESTREEKRIRNDHDFPKANNISGDVNDKKYTLEQAVRFKPPPWRLTPEWQEADARVEQGYLLIGKPKAGKPCISHDFKRVFATQAEMANALNYDNSDLGRLLGDHTPDEVLHTLDRVFR